MKYTKLYVAALAEQTQQKLVESRCRDHCGVGCDVFIDTERCVMIVCCRKCERVLFEQPIGE